MSRLAAEPKLFTKPLPTVAHAEWAHQRNVEAGVLIRNAEFVRQLRQQFDSLIETKLVRRLPGF